MTINNWKIKICLLAVSACQDFELSLVQEKMWCLQYTDVSVKQYNVQLLCMYVHAMCGSLIDVAKGSSFGVRVTNDMVSEEFLCWPDGYAVYVKWETCK